MRYSLKWLLIVMAVLSAGIAALLLPSESLQTALYMLGWFSMVLSALTFVGCRGTFRSSAGGYFIGALSYLMPLYNEPDVHKLIGPPRLVEKYVLPTVHRAIFPHLFRRQLLPGDVVVPQGSDTYWIKGRAYYSYGSEVHFTRSTLNVAAMILFGCMGGMVTSHLYRRTERRERIQQELGRHKVP
jgi:hypothetical protein